MSLLFSGTALGRFFHNAFALQETRKLSLVPSLSSPRPLSSLARLHTGKVANDATPKLPLAEWLRGTDNSLSARTRAREKCRSPN